MPNTQRFNQSLAAGAAADLLTGRALQDAPAWPRGAYRSVYASQDTGDGVVAVSVGTDTPIQESSPNVRTAVEVNQDMDLLGQFYIRPGDRIRMNANNPGAGATEFRILVIDTPA